MVAGRYFKGFVVDYFVFKCGMNAITYYAYTFSLPGRNPIVVILHKE